MNTQKLHSTLHFWLIVIKYILPKVITLSGTYTVFVFGLNLNLLSILTRRQLRAIYSVCMSLNIAKKHE